MPDGRVWSVQYGSISSIRKAQLQFLFSKEALAWVKDTPFWWMSRQMMPAGVVL